MIVMTTQRRVDWLLSALEPTGLRWLAEQWVADYSTEAPRGRRYVLLPPDAWLSLLRLTSPLIHSETGFYRPGTKALHVSAHQGVAAAISARHRHPAFHAQAVPVETGTAIGVFPVWMNGDKREPFGSSGGEFRLLIPTPVNIAGMGNCYHWRVTAVTDCEDGPLAIGKPEPHQKWIELAKDLT